ncbi:trypsin-like serine peptidase [Alcanivoracaceae bacterium MT1]
MSLRRGGILPALILALAATLFPSSSFAIRVGETETPYPTFLADIQVTIEVIRPGQRAQQAQITGTGAFIAPNLVVTAAHMIREPDVEDGAQAVITDITVTGVSRNGRRFVTAVVEDYAATSDLRPEGLPQPAGADIAVLELRNPMDVEVLYLPHELGIGMDTQQELVGTVYGQRIPDREHIEQAYDQLFNADLSFTDEGRRLIESRPDAEARNLWMPSEIVEAGTVANLSSMSAPFVRMRVPHSPQLLADPWFFVGTFPESFLLTFNTGRQGFIDSAYQAASRLPFHRGDSGAPFVSRAPSGQMYLAGVVSGMVSEMLSGVGESGHFIYRPAIATEDLTELLSQRMGLTQGINRDNTIFWADPHGTVPTLDNWNDDTGVRLDALPSDLPGWPPAESRVTLCNLNDLLNSDFCRYLRGTLTSNYTIRPISMHVEAPDAEFYPYPSDPDLGEYRLHGQISYYSPENITYNSTTTSPMDTPLGWAFNFSESTPVRIRGSASGTRYLDPNTLHVQADEGAPTICLATPSESGVFARVGAGIGRNQTIVPGGQSSCIIANETTRNANGTYDIPLEGDGGTITFQMQIEPATAPE